MLEAAWGGEAKGATGPAATAVRLAAGGARDLGRSPTRRGGMRRCAAERRGAGGGDRVPPHVSVRRDPDEHGAPRRLSEAPIPVRRRLRATARRAPADLLCIVPCARPRRELRMRGGASLLSPLATRAVGRVAPGSADVAGLLLGVGRYRPGRSHCTPSRGAEAGRLCKRVRREPSPRQVPGCARSPLRRARAGGLRGAAPVLALACLPLPTPALCSCKIRAVAYKTDRVFVAARCSPERGVRKPGADAPTKRQRWLELKWSSAVSKVISSK